MTQPVRLAQFRSVQLLEDKILLQTWRWDALPVGAEELIDFVTRDLFDITYEETEALADAALDASDAEEIDVQDQNDDQLEGFFDTDSLSDDQIVSYFLTLGLDFRDSRGQPLRSTIFLARTAEAACKKMGGKLPSDSEAAEKDWAARLHEEAQAYIRKKVG